MSGPETERVSERVTVCAQASAQRPRLPLARALGILVLLPSPSPSSLLLPSLFSLLSSPDQSLFVLCTQRIFARSFLTTPTVIPSLLPAGRRFYSRCPLDRLEQSPQPLPWPSSRVSPFCPRLRASPTALLSSLSTSAPTTPILTSAMRPLLPPFPCRPLMCISTRWLPLPKFR